MNIVYVHVSQNKGKVKDVILKLHGAHPENECSIHAVPAMISF